MSNTLETLLNTILEDPALIANAKEETKKALLNAFIVSDQLHRQLQITSVSHDYLVTILTKSQPFTWVGLNPVQQGRWMAFEASRYPIAANYSPKPKQKDTFSWTQKPES